MNASEKLIKRFRNREANIAVVGLGYVGLPLAVAFSEAGHHVTGIDSSETKIEALKRGISYIDDVPSEKILGLLNNRSGRPICFASDYRSVEVSDAVVICVPTPLAKTGDPDISYILAAGESIGVTLAEDTLIVLESTTYPDATKELLAPLISDSEKGNFTLGENVFLAYSPERIDPGRTDWTVTNTPKVVGGMTAGCTELASELYGTIIDTVVPVSNTTSAEMVKLLENTFRATNIALVNEIAIMCERLGVDVWEVISAAGTKPFGFMPFYPGPGLGGHCIPIDPKYLSWRMKKLDYEARIIGVADEINSGMPRYVVSRIKDILGAKSKQLSGSTVLVLGVAYRPDVSDLRESPALDVMSLLEEEGACVSYNDPYVPSLLLEETESKYHSVELTSDVLSEKDLVVIITDHSSYQWEFICSMVKHILDTRNAITLDQVSSRVSKL